MRAGWISHSYYLIMNTNHRTIPIPIYATCATAQLHIEASPMPVTPLPQQSAHQAVPPPARQHLPDSRPNLRE